MGQSGLRGKTAAILVADNFHVLEAYYPYFRLREEGAAVFFVGPQAGAVYRDPNGEPVTANLSVEEALSLEFDLVHCPGGFAPLTLRADEDMLRFARDHFHQGGLFSTICHGGSFLVSLDVLRGRRATGYRTLKDDLVNAGAEYTDEATVVDGNLITARAPADLPVFMEAVVAAMKGVPGPIANLARKRAALLVENRYQIHQVWYTCLRLRSRDVDTVCIGPGGERTVFSRCSQYPLCPDLPIGAASDLYDAVVVTGDWAADRMRTEPEFVGSLRRHDREGRLVASIAEGHSVLVSAGLLSGRRVASLPEMRADVQNAGAAWVGPSTAVDGNLVTAGGTFYLPRFLAAILAEMESPDPKGLGTPSGLQGPDVDRL